MGEGVDMFDGYTGDSFKLHVMLFCTINEFPAYGNLSGYSTKGHKACPICEEGTCYRQLQHGRKIVYLGHQRFLSTNNPYRKLKKAFNGCQENELAPMALSGSQVYERVKDIGVILGKTQKKALQATYGRKEKHVCDSIIETLLNIQGKTKNGLNARLDLVEMGIREQLAPISHGKRTYLPPACHTLCKQEKMTFVSFYKGILPKNLRYTLTRLCFLFNAICSKVIEIEKLDQLENEVVVILCQLEMYFPPSIFDIMVHLIIHLHHVERFIVEEAIEFCADYLSYVKAIGVPRSRDHGRGVGKGTRSAKVVTLNRAEILRAHMYILNNTEEVIPYLSAHKDIVKRNNPRMPQKWVINEHNKTFLKWFKQQVQVDRTTSDTLNWLSSEPNFDVICWSGYDINNYTFHTQKEDEKSTTQNSGVMVVAESMHFSSSKDKNPVMASMCYFGVIEDIWVINYTSFKVPVFKCKWVDGNTGMRTDDLGFTLVDLEKEGYIEEPFIMASQAKQVFYVTGSEHNRWSVVLQDRTIHYTDDNDEAVLDISETPSFSSNMPTLMSIMK
ncbi:uncharacterized protein LOC124822207 [Vigna umbellata]|uniref:uncharacterized protein LOC124822207 n=1 Tax=Vigna umbellata TaxID=87088 RepID=UPI001F5E434D|nr:uncharacterized protein LOC124822207 [Vigna umbellata]